jgi:hydrogenase assembly chaperone HypC/HupF
MDRESKNGSIGLSASAKKFTGIRLIIDMCISIPAKIVSLSGSTAEVDVEGSCRTVLNSLPNLAVGNWVLLHGAAIAGLVTQTEAHEIRSLIGILNNQPSGHPEDR